jgi:hypothetical protein
MKYFIFILSTFLWISCTPTGKPGPQGEAGIPGKDGIQGPPGEQGIQGLKGDVGKVDPALLSQLEAALKKVKEPSMINSGEEVIVASVQFSFGIAPPIMGFAILTSHGNLYRLKNKNPVTLGEEYEFIVRVGEHKNFVSLSFLSGGEGQKNFYIAITEDGHSYVSEDLQSWNSKGSISY